MSRDSWQQRPLHAMLAGKEEDRFTECLADLLHSKTVLEHFLLDLCQITLKDFTDISVHTQFTVPGGRPDLIIKGPDHFCIFEAKVGSLLHEGQARPYAEKLKYWKQETISGIARLFILTPQANMKSSVETAKQQIAETGFCEADVNGVAWETIADLFRRLSPQSSDPRLSVYLEDFADLIEHRVGKIQRPFTAEEAELLTDQLTANALFMTRELVEPVIESLTKKLAVFNLHLNSTIAASKYYDGYNLKVEGIKYLWLGMWIQVWARVGGSPLLIQFGDERLTAHDPSDFPGGGLPEPAKNEKGGWFVPLPIKPGVEAADLTEQLAETAAQYIRHWHGLLNHS